MPLIGTMATRNFTDILQLFQEGRVLEPSVDDRDRVLERGLAKRAPFLRGKNSTADAMLIEMYATFATSLSDPTDVCGFVTSNNKDFSQEKGDVRLPHHFLTPTSLRCSTERRPATSTASTAFKTSWTIISGTSSNRS